MSGTRYFYLTVLPNLKLEIGIEQVNYRSFGLRTEIFTNDYFFSIENQEISLGIYKYVVFKKTANGFKILTFNSQLHSLEYGQIFSIGTVPVMVPIKIP